MPPDSAAAARWPHPDLRPTRSDLGTLQGAAPAARIHKHQHRVLCQPARLAEVRRSGCAQRCRQRRRSRAPRMQRQEQHKALRAVATWRARHGVPRAAQRRCCATAAASVACVIVLVECQGRTCAHGGSNRCRRCCHCCGEIAGCGWMQRLLVARHACAKRTALSAHIGGMACSHS